MVDAKHLDCLAARLADRGKPTDAADVDIGGVADMASSDQ